MAIDLYIKRIRATPYKLVFSKDNIIGVFDHNKYISKSNLNNKHKDVLVQYAEEVTKNDSVS